MAVVEVQKIKQKTNSTSKRELYAMISFYYPQYTLKEAAKLTSRDSGLLIKTAQRIEAQKMYNLTQIVASPHTKNASGVSKILDHFKRLAES